MVGKVISFYEKAKKAGGSYLTVLMEVNGQQVQYLCTDPATMDVVSNSVNSTIDFYTFQSKDKTATFMTLPKGTQNLQQAPQQAPQQVTQPKESLTDVPEHVPEHVEELKTKATHYYPRNQMAGKNESFAASYAKDIAVACINQGIIKESKGIDATIRHYNSLFLELMNPTE